MNHKMSDGQAKAMMFLLGLVALYIVLVTVPFEVIQGVLITLFVCALLYACMAAQLRADYRANEGKILKHLGHLDQL